MIYGNMQVYGDEFDSIPMYFNKRKPTLVVVVKQTKI